MLTTIHYIYIAFVLIIFVTLLMKKDIVIPCLIGIFAIAFAFSKDFFFALSSIYNTLIYAGNEFWGIIVIISLVVAMSKALSEVGADELIISPIKRVMVNHSFAFFVVGLMMMAVSWIIWPSPSVALIGAILLPAAIESGLPALWAAVSMNLFGHGIALCSDFFIQGAPTITAKAANVSPTEIMVASLPLWAVMSVVTIGVAYWMFKQDMKKKASTQAVDKAQVAADDKALENATKAASKPRPTKTAYFIAIFTPLVFIGDVFILYALKLTGGDATALVGGTAIFILLLASILNFKVSKALDKVVDYLKEGFGFGIRVFAPVIVIGGFFFLGNEGIAKSILGEGARGLLNDISMVLSDKIGVSKLSALLTQGLVAAITGLDGSGFSGLPIVGSLAYSLSSVMKINSATLAAFGQIVTVWIGGGTIIPWAVIPVAAICGVSPAELVRRNLVPVLCGIGATLIAALILI